MRRWAVAAMAVVGLVAATMLASAPAASASTFVSKGTSMGKWGYLLPRQQLVSPSGRYRATLQLNGQFSVRDGVRLMWITPGLSAHARVFMHENGNVTVMAGPRLLWSSGTAGAGPYARLVMQDNGSLVVRRPKGVAWSSRFGNRCRSYQSGRKIFVDLSEQFMWMCAADQEEMTSSITSGAVEYGDATPTGTWYVQSHQRDRYLYPASGGAYFVHYWMPYDYDYGFHDSPWQHFPYGSALYRTRGSHGCVHVPAVVMSFAYYWAQTGTIVSIRA